MPLCTYRYAQYQAHTKTHSYQTEVVDRHFVLFKCNLFPKHGWVIITASAESTAWTYTHIHIKKTCRFALLCIYK